MDIIRGCIGNLIDLLLSSTLFAIAVALAASFGVLWLLYPVLAPVPIPTPLTNTTVYGPLYVVPGQKYKVTVVASKPQVSFTVREGNDFLILRPYKSTEEPTPRMDAEIEIARPPQFVFHRQNAKLIIVSSSPGEPTRSQYVQFPINSLVMPLRITLSVAGTLVALPGFAQIAGLFVKGG